MRTLYRLLTLLLTPLALLRLQRGETQPGRWRERLGWMDDAPPGTVWIHAASVGEVNAAQGMIQALLDCGETLLISTMTVTGANRCMALFGERVEHRYLALDNPFAVKAWLKRTRPRIGLVVETEIWPELFARCRSVKIPLLMISARVSTPALRRYRRFARLFSQALASVDLATCQTETDARRLESLGLRPERCVVTGNLKFDIELPEDLGAQAEALRSAWGQRTIWTAGSTRPGEEPILIAAHDTLQKSYPQALLVLAPRHPDRAAEVAELLNDRGLEWCRFGEVARPSTSVILVDRLGVLMSCYAVAQVAFVGGSLVRRGGHNLLEPAGLALPVLTGPHLDQQTEAADALESTGGLIRVVDANDLGLRLQELLANPNKAEGIGRAAQAAIHGGRGSLERTLAAVGPWLGTGPRKTSGPCG
ncbi:MAG: 3-deoxy-D-manno-octulosonic acid transferase [Wenzhouxiangella sp.]|jgi:3-deoxy-D-manno-octulosonic-acid transferase|nr:3-deoxy-D-manno-octulosonic acid transferase [Wenzhouxiangella sp.]